MGAHDGAYSRPCLPSFSAAALSYLLVVDTAVMGNSRILCYTSNMPQGENQIKAGADAE